MGGGNLFEKLGGGMKRFKEVIKTESILYGKKACTVVNNNQLNELLEFDGYFIPRKDVLISSV